MAGIDETKLKEKILTLSQQIYAELRPGFLMEWLTSDLTVAQMRILLLLHRGGNCRMGELAQAMDVALSTTTGIVDNLIAKDMVLRRTASRDRRVIELALSPKGQDLTDKLFYFSRSQIERILDGLDEDQLGRVYEAAETLKTNLANSGKELVPLAE